MARKLVFDLKGQTFGLWVVLQRMPGNKWKCRCRCGVEKEVYGGSLRNGLSQSCGCHNRAVARAKSSDLTGRTVGRLTVVARADDERWRCVCKCGNELLVKHRALRKSETKSCGCLKHDVLLVLHKTHGRRYSSEWRSWSGMIQRCHNAKNTAYDRYGGRGILVCDQWRGSFEQFFSDMGEMPGPEYSLDRIDNDKGYEPQNCRWATPKEQRHNQRRMKQ